MTPDPSRIYRAERTIKKREITKCLRENFQSGHNRGHEGTERHEGAQRCGVEMWQGQIIMRHLYDQLSRWSLSLAEIPERWWLQSHS